MKNLLVDKLVEVVNFGNFTLTSGKESKVYVDVKLTCTEPEVLKLITNEILKQTQLLNWNRVVCAELGGVPIAVSLSLSTGKPYTIFRKPGRSHGVKETFVGKITKGERVLVVEDVTTTGSSVMKVIKEVKNCGGKILGVISVVDRGEGALELLQKENFTSLVTLEELKKRKNFGNKERGGKDENSRSLQSLQ